MIGRLTRLLGVVWAMVVLCGVAEAAPFARQIPFVQPDGTDIVLWGEGDEFRAVFETLDGYTVIFDAHSRAYHYARHSVDGTLLESSGVWVGKGDPKALGLAKHLRADAQVVRKQARIRQERWEAGMGVAKRWSALKAARRQADAALKSGAITLAPPATNTVGTKVGLTLLIDFDDDPATIPQAEIFSFCNGDEYKGYGNNGSVKKYFQDNSGGMLTYSNIVTVYIRIPNTLHRKRWYNDTTKDCGDQANYLIQDAVTIMKALPNYNSAILPALANLTVDAGNSVVAFNVFYAGGNGGRWDYGLWPHSWVLWNVGPQELSPGGKQLYKYQVTNIGSKLELGTFCHENGHMLCDYPDIYDYEYDSIGGAGMFCLMNSGGDGVNPVQICAYLKRASGWGTTTELDFSSSLLATVSSSGTNFNHFYRYVNPDAPTEYFLVENRQAWDRDERLPGGGVAIWHIDELGDRDDQSMVPNFMHANYEVTLVQADNAWHFQNDVNDGDAYDLYHSVNTAPGYVNEFTDNTAPAARWWDGSKSRLAFRNFSALGSTMTFSVEPLEPIDVTPYVPVKFTGPPGGPFTPASASYDIVKQRTGDLNWQVSMVQPWLDFASPTNGTLFGDEINTVVVVPTNAYAATLSDGFYTNLLTFSDLTHTVDVTRAVYLRVGSNYTFCSTPYVWTTPDTMTELSFTGGVSTTIAIPFTFSFYDQPISNLHVTAHGLIGFGDVSDLGAATPQALGTTNPPLNIVAPLWSDVDGSFWPANVTWGVAGTEPERQFIVRWTRARSEAEPAATNTFQVVISETTLPMDNTIDFQYRDVAQDAPLTGGGRTATIGIQDPYGPNYRQYSSGGSSLLADAMAVRFTLQPPVDTNGPVPTITFLREEGSNLVFEVRFDEIVAGALADTDFDVGGTLSNVTAVTDVSGNGVYGLRYLVTATVAESNDYGSVVLTLRGGVIVDLKGNGNAASAPYLYVRPFRNVVFQDDMELGPFQWTTSGSNVLSDFVSDVWKWGYAPFAHSGSNCWGTGMTGLCPDYSWATLQTRTIPVGGYPVLRYAVWQAFASGGGEGFVEVFDGTTWYNVTPTPYGSYTEWMGGWQEEVVVLDPLRFGNRDLRVRFRVVTAPMTSGQYGMFIDDVSLSGYQPPGVWVTEMAPSAGLAPSAVSLAFTAYNSSTVTLEGVSAAVSSHDDGVTVTGRVSYGQMIPGAVVAGDVSVPLTLAAPGNFRVPLVSIFHSARSTTGSVGEHSLPFIVSNVTAVTESGTLVVKLATDSSGVSDTLGRYLKGDGGAASCLFQVIAAGTNGVRDLPGAGGLATGDDRILYEQGGTRGYGRFGIGGVAADRGRFVKAFLHSLTNGTKVYVRAWDASSADAAVLYGDSAPLAISNVVAQTNAYVAWSVTNIVNYARDLNGDGVPDGWCIRAGLDPRAPQDPLIASWSQQNAVSTGLGVDPNRVLVFSNWVYVAQGSDFNNSVGQIDVWTRDLSTHVQTFGSKGSGVNQFYRPRGMAMASTTNWLAVADTENSRIVVLTVNPTNGTLAWVGTFGTGYLWKPQGVAMDTAGNFYVADTKDNRVVVFSPTGVPDRLLDTNAIPNPVGICVDSAGHVYVANSGSGVGGHSVMMFNNDGTSRGTLGGFGTNDGFFSKPTDVQLGIGGRIYVMDQDNARVQMFATNGEWIATYKAPLSLLLPNGLWPSMDDGSLYIADTRHQQVLRTWPVSDRDGDGMDDVWEDLHQAYDPYGDLDGDGVFNLGEYRVKTDPRKIDTNGNGGSDLWDMLHGIDPVGAVTALENPPPHLVSVTCDVTGRPVVYGETVRLTANFDKPMTDEPPPNLGLNGGATLAATPMVQTNANGFELAYVVQPTDAGWVNVTLNNAYDRTGQASDPTILSVTGVFSVITEVIRITTMTDEPYTLSWPAISSFVYQVESTPSLLTNDWPGAFSVTSPVNDLLTVPVEGPTTNNPVFYRVWRTHP